VREDRPAARAAVEPLAVPDAAPEAERLRARHLRDAQPELALGHEQRHRLAGLLPHLEHHRPGEHADVEVRVPDVDQLRHRGAEAETLRVA
jgi:hypothetical protein